MALRHLDRWRSPSHSICDRSITTLGHADSRDGPLQWLPMKGVEVDWLSTLACAYTTGELCCRPQTADGNLFWREATSKPAGRSISIPTSLLSLSSRIFRGTLAAEVDLWIAESHVQPPVMGACAQIESLLQLSSHSG